MASDSEAAPRGDEEMCSSRVMGSPWVTWQRAAPGRNRTIVRIETVADCGPVRQLVAFQALPAGVIARPRKASAPGMRARRLIRCGLVTGREGIARALSSARLA